MYDINLKNVEKGKSFFYSFLIVGLFFLVIVLYCTFFDESNDFDYFNILLLPCLLMIPLTAICVSIFNLQKINKRIKVINELNQKGKLVKGLKYHLEDTGMVDNGVHVERPVVYYTLPNDVTLILYGDPRHDGETMDSDGLVDLVIDENNPENYFIDFEINRLSGNLSQDYYDNSQQPLFSNEDFENMSPTPNSQTDNNNQSL